MCNLYRLVAPPNQIEAMFAAERSAEFNFGEPEIYPGGRGVVVRKDGGSRVVQAMTWGFPIRLKSMKPESKPKPANNIANLDSYPWKFIAGKPEHRCLIPLTGFCEAEGEKGKKTRTWFSLNNRPLFAWAGMWKESHEWGAVYSGLMTDANECVAPVHNRMPVLLNEDEYDRWLEGSLADVRRFQDRTFPSSFMRIERTSDVWSRAARNGPSQSLL